jgi:hypothetical protein
MVARGEGSGFVRQFGLFDDHIFEFARFEDFSAFEALNEFGVFFAGHDLHTRMLTFWHVTSLLGELGRRDWIHKSGLFSGPSGPERILPEFVRYCRTADLVVKPHDSIFRRYGIGLSLLQWHFARTGLPRLSGDCFFALGRFSLNPPKLFSYK